MGIPILMVQIIGGFFEEDVTWAGAGCVCGGFKRRRGSSRMGTYLSNFP